MRFVPFSEVKAKLTGRRIAVVGSGPSVLDNDPKFIDSHQIVVRINNYKLGPSQGYRTDVHHSFYGGSIRKTANELKGDGVTLCVCKCPDSKPIDSPWHEQNRKLAGIDFRYIYQNRKDWWFCDTHIPDEAHFKVQFELLQQHVPTSGFSAILDVLACEPKSVYVTGFDFFSSKIHNVNENWKAGNPEDPIGHRPELERAWLIANRESYPLTFDEQLTRIIRQQEGRAP